MTRPNQNPNSTNGLGLQCAPFDQRRLRSRQHEFAGTPARPGQKQRPAITYVEFLWSLPARKTLREVMQASS